MCIRDSHGIAQELQKGGVNVQLDSTPPFPERAIKTPREITAIRRSQRAAVAAMRGVRDTIEQENQNALTIEGIQRMVAEYYDIRLGDMTSKQRPQNIAFPRQVAMYLCRELTEQSLPAIGNAFGRNHATVLHAHRSVGAKMKTDAGLRQTILSLQQRLGGAVAPS